MTFAEVMAELRSHHPAVFVAPSAAHGACSDRAARVQFKRSPGGVYVGRDADGTEVLVYFNDTAKLICCTELDPDTRADNAK